MPGPPGLPISIVTDFDEFALYDGRLEPKPQDGAAVARLMFLGFAELAAEWEKLESLISYQAVRGGSLEKHAETSPGKARHIRGRPASSWPNWNNGAVLWPGI